MERFQQDLINAYGADVIGHWETITVLFISAYGRCVGSLGTASSLDFFPFSGSGWWILLFQYSIQAIKMPVLVVQVECLHM